MIWSEREETFKIWDLWDSDLQFHSSLQCLFPSLAHEIWMWWWQHLGWLDDYTLAWWWWQMTTSNRKLQLFQNKNNPATHFLKVRYTCTLHSGIRNKVSILPPRAWRLELALATFNVLVFIGKPLILSIGNALQEGSPC